MRSASNPADVVPPYFRQILHASPLRMRENLSERSLLAFSNISGRSVSFLF